MEMPMRRLVRKRDKNENSILHMVGVKLEDQKTKNAKCGCCPTSNLPNAEKNLDFDPFNSQVTENETRSPAFELRDDLLLFERVEKLIKIHYHKSLNSEKRTVEELFATNKEDLREKAQEWLKNTAQNCSIIAVLIATVAFAAAYTLPGGSNQDTGAPVLLNQTFFVIFSIGDVISLTFTLTAVVIFLSILTSPFRLQDFKQSLPQKLMLGVTCLILSVSMMMLAFAATIILVIRNGEAWTRIALYTIAFLPVSVFAISYMPLYLYLMGTFKYTLTKIWSFFPRFTWSDTDHDSSEVIEVEVVSSTPCPPTPELTRSLV